MPEFQYIAREMTGQQVTGVLSATSEQDALSSLAARRLFPVRVNLAATEVTNRKRVGRRVRGRYLSVFYTQLADLLRSGVPLLRSLELLARQSSHPTLKLVVQDVCDEVRDGSRLHDALRQHPAVFNELAVSMVRAGEEGSFLEDVLKRIATFTDHQDELRSKVVGAMIYPVFLLVMGTAIVCAMLTFFVPKFQPFFDRMTEAGTLPWATSALMAISESISSYGVIIAAVVIAAGIFLSRSLATEAGRLRFDRLRLRAFLVGPIVRSLATARFCRILGTLLKNGVPILHSLRIAKDASGNRVLSNAIESAADNVSAGKSLAQPLASCKEFPEEIVEMIAVAEEANNLEQVLLDIAENLERQANRQLEMFVRLLEPVMLLAMAGIVLFVVVALLLPILQTSSLI